MFAQSSLHLTQSLQATPWKILVVDDDPAIHSLTTVVLRNFIFQGRKLELIDAYSGKEAQDICHQHPDLALILLDVVMETDDAGLKVVKYVRDSLQNRTVRIILRTGQPGAAPEKQVIVDYDINDYKEKTELTNHRLFTTVVSSLRSFQEIDDRLKAEKALQQREARLRLFNQVILEFTQRKTLAIGDWKATLHEITEATARTLHLERVSVWLHEPETHRFICDDLFEANSQRHFSDPSWPLTENSADYLAQLEDVRALSIQNLHQSTRGAILAPHFQIVGTVALLDLPIRLRQKIVGVVRCEHTKAREWLLEEENFAVSMADFLAMKLFQQEHENQIRARARMEAELQTASALQKAFLPRKLPRYETLEFASFYRSASETGGDWFGFMTQFEGFLFIMIGDVTGHGIPAALITATASATCSTLERLYARQKQVPSPSQLLQELNEAILEVGETEFLMTFFVAQIDLETGCLRYSNAAHNFPVRIHPDGQLDALINVNAHLGRRSGIRFTESETYLEPGETLLFFTDGLVDNGNQQEARWGEARLRHYLQKSYPLPLQTMTEGLAKTILEFYRDSPLQDDVTFLTCRVLSPFPQRPFKG